MTLPSKLGRLNEERAFVLEFIKTYRSLPCLWDVESPDYCDRIKRIHQYDILLAKYRERYPDAEKADLSKKINTLRTNFRREWNRLNQLRKHRGEDYQDIQSTLWYFDEMSFIKDVDLRCSPRGEVKKEKKSIKNLQEEPVRKRIKKSEDPLESYQEQYLTEEPEIYKYTKHIEPPESPPPQRSQREPEIHKKMADIWASKWKALERTQQLYAEKFINEILFEGALGTLHRTAVQIHPDRMSSPITAGYCDSETRLESVESLEMD